MTSSGDRTTKSADVERPLGGGGGDSTDDLRPVTASSTISVVSIKATKQPKSRGGGRTPTTAATRADRGLAASISDALMDGWGDFDTDRLLYEDPEVIAATLVGERQSGQATPSGETHAVDSGDRGSSAGVVHDAEPSARREFLPQRQPPRNEALARHSAKPAPPIVMKEPPREVVRQRTLAVMELEAPEAVTVELHNVASSSAVATHNGSSIAGRRLLVVHRRGKTSSDSESSETRLPRIKFSSSTSSAVVSPRSAGLLGPSIADSFANRELVFERFLPMWSLMSSRGSATSRRGDGSPSTTTSSVASESKSPFECSMVLMKICRTLGISLAASPAVDVWNGSANRRRTAAAAAMARSNAVDLASFCDFVVRNAVQPAMHHFRLDRGLDEYVHTVDAVVHSLVVRCPTENEHEQENAEQAEETAVSQWRLRELSEIQPVLPHWKKGILAVQRQTPLVKMSPSAATTAYAEEDGGDHCAYGSGAAAIVSTDDDALYALRGSVAVVLPASPPRGKTLPVHEARALQDANIRRKIQLRKSWQPRVLLDAPPGQPPNQHGTAPLDGDADVVPLGSCIRVAAVAPPQAATLPLDGISTSIADNQTAEAETKEEHGPPQAGTETERPLVLLCGSCADEEEREATLWCSRCFAVFCAACWTATHHSVVDLSMVTNQRELPVAPSARPMRTQRGGEGTTHHHHEHTSPVAMLYLPTKPLPAGKLLRGSTSKHQQLTGNQQEEAESHEAAHASDDERKALALAMSSHPILPSIRPTRLAREKPLRASRSTPAIDRADAAAAASAMDSTANLLKALMLGTASSASVLGGSIGTPSPWSTSTDATAHSGKAASATKRVYVDPPTRKKLHAAAVTLDAMALFPGK